MEAVIDYSLLNDPDMKEIFDSFIVETREILEKLDVDLVELENRPDDTELLNQIFRSFHTIKGTAGFLGLVVLQKITHRGEEILNKLRKGEMILNDVIMDAILASYDGLKELTTIIENNKNEDYDADGLINQLQNVIDGNYKSASATSKNAKPADDHDDDLPRVEDYVQKPLEKLSIDEIEELEPEEIQQIEVPKATKIVEQPKAAEQKDASKVKKEENTIRVDVERLDDLLNFVSELVLGRNMLSQINAEASSEHEGTKLARDLAEATRQIDLMTTELQLSVMKTRMIKIGKVFNRFPRLVRDLSKDSGKKIQLIIKGEDTELDKTLIEEINDPLVHLVRNSADHGVEDPDVRRKAGKPEQGTITLSADHEGNNILITIEDDGKGIDTEKIKEKAVSKGLISEERSKELTKQDAYSLIFLPGFSTAEKVTNVSGRGVGMDVVKTNVTKLRGVINIDSVVGEGTKIVIKLPLTLAIIHGLLVSVCGETVVIPLNSVVEIVRIPKDKIHSINQNEVIKLRETVLPLIDVDMLLYHKATEVEDKEQQYVVVVAIAEKKFGLKVDGLLGQKEVVIKSLGNYLGTVEGIGGSTIMGDGKVVMIADIAELVNKIVG